MSAFLHQEPAQRTHSISRTSLRVLPYGVHRIERKTQRRMQRGIVYAMYVSGCTTSLQSTLITGFLDICFARNPPTEQRQVAGYQSTCFALCPVNRRASHCLLIPHKNFHCPTSGLLWASCVTHKRKREMITTYCCCVKTGHTKTIKDYNRTLYALALKAQAMSSLERWIYRKYVNCHAAQDNLFPITDRDKLFKNKISDS